jgi:hypothetical protein
MTTAKEGKNGSKEGKEKEEISNEPDLAFLLSPGPLPQAGLFVPSPDHSVACVLGSHKSSRRE